MKLSKTKNCQWGGVALDITPMGNNDFSYGLALASQKKEKVRFAHEMNNMIDIQNKRPSPIRTHKRAAQIKSSDRLEHETNGALKRAVSLREEAFENI